MPHLAFAAIFLVKLRHICYCNIAEIRLVAKLVIIQIKDSNGQITAGVERCCTRKFDRGLGQILHDELHWLGVPDWVLSKLAVIIVSDSSPVSERPRITVSIGTLHPGLQC